MATNLFTRFRKLIPTFPLRVGTIQAIDGTSVRIEETGGGLVTLIGTGTVGQRVYFRNGVIEDEAPDLPFMSVEE